MAPLSKTVIAWVAAGIATATVVVVVVLWWAGTRGLTGQQLVTARFDALRTGLSIGLGGGGLFALYLAWRRQHSTEIGLAQKQQDQADVARAYELQREAFESTRRHQERVAAATERDAEARRITDLYAKAIEQLGSDKAPVRLGGLYALERLAQDNVEQRQTIVNVFCAYLRMPYILPNAAPGADADDKLIDAHRERTQEREVRLAAQRILAYHLRSGDGDNPVETFWADLDLDFTGAVLVDLDFSRCTIHTVTFDLARFYGETTFSKTLFTKITMFDGATFNGLAAFSEATFSSVAGFAGTTFDDTAGFRGATFDRVAMFGSATFNGAVGFDKVEFNDNAWFRGARFNGDARFSDATFSSDASTGTNFTDVHFERGVPHELVQYVSPSSSNAVEP